MKKWWVVGLCAFFILGFLLISGCIDPKAKRTASTATPTSQIVYTSVPIPAQTTVQKKVLFSDTPLPATQHKISDGFWCRETTINIGKAPTNVKECYQFFADGTYKWGYSPGRAMGKSQSCSGDPNAKCEYSSNSKGQYEVQGGYSYTLSGDTLIDPHDPPYFIWSSKGIP